MKEDLREVLRSKAEKHQKYYQQLVRSYCPAVDLNGEGGSTTDEDLDRNRRYRRTGVYQITNTQDEVEGTVFQSVHTLKAKYLALLEQNGTHNEENALLMVPSPNSGYCSGGSDDEKCSQMSEKRCDSTDSAMGPSDEDVPKREEFLSCCYSPRESFDYGNVPSRMLIEAQCVALPLVVDDGYVGAGHNVDEEDDETDENEKNRRRHSCFSEEGDEQPRYRYWRTPSVVVSDYSDDIMGLTLDDIEFIRNQRRDTASSSPESSVYSSCSNLNYCGSTISSLDADYILKQPFRKSSDCSTCSTLSGGGGGTDEYDTSSSLGPDASGWRKLRNIVQWTPFFQTYKKQRYPWVQLAGHQGNFKAGPDQGTILKKLCIKEEKCFKLLMKDVLRPYVPEYKGLVASDDAECSYIQLQDLLGDFVAPCVMDCKIGVRTYLEEELAKAKEKPKLRRDMYEKMCQIDSEAPTDDEHRQKAITKPRYMVWRETISSTATLGFRIEGIRRCDGTSSKDFKTTKTKDQIVRSFVDFLNGFPHALPKYIQRLKAIKVTLENSKFFNRHEIIGSSLLFVHDGENANVWLIDFAKTVKLPEGVQITHSNRWTAGNHEDGYLIGINNLISIFMTMLENQPIAVTPPLSIPDPPQMTANTRKLSSECN